MKKTVDFDKFTDNYNQLLNESTNFFSENENYFAKYKIDIVKKNLLKTPTNILEYGCGIGRNIHFLKESFPLATIHGSDISLASLDIARKINPDIYFFSENDIHNTLSSYDLIFIAGVFHHIPPSLHDSVISKLKERLSPSGALFIFEHNPYNPITREIVDKCPYDEDAILIKPFELKNKLSLNSLSIVSREFCLFIPPKLKYLLLLEKYLGWLPLGGQYWIHARHSH